MCEMVLKHWTDGEPRALQKIFTHRTHHCSGSSEQDLNLHEEETVSTRRLISTIELPFQHSHLARAPHRGDLVSRDHVDRVRA